MKIEFRNGVTTDVFRSISYKTNEHGSYAMVFQRRGQPPYVDLQYFNGDRDAAELELFAEMIKIARAKVAEWSKDGWT